MIRTCIDGVPLLDEPIVIESLYEFEGGNLPLSWYCRGHVDLDAFLAAVRDYFAPV